MKNRYDKTITDCFVGYIVQAAGCQLESCGRELSARHQGKMSIEKGKDGFIFIVFAVKQKNDVNELTLDMIEMGLEPLYEPRNKLGRYESCILCNEKIGIKIVAY